MPIPIIPACASLLWGGMPRGAAPILALSIDDLQLVLSHLDAHRHIAAFAMSFKHARAAARPLLVELQRMELQIWKAKAVHTHVRARIMRSTMCELVTGTSANREKYNAYRALTSQGDTRLQNLTKEAIKRAAADSVDPIDLCEVSLDELEKSL